MHVITSPDAISTRIKTVVNNTGERPYNNDILGVGEAGATEKERERESLPPVFEAEGQESETP